MLMKKDDLEEDGWNVLAKESLKEVWNNKKDGIVWEKYIKTC